MNHRYTKPFAGARRTRRVSGFTLIELIVVIVVLAILGATALPKMLSVGDDAKASALTQIAGAANSAHALNLAGCTVKGHVPTPGKCVLVNDCSQTGSLMQGTGLPTGYTVASVSLTAVNGTEGTCQVTQTSTGQTANFTGIAAGN